MTRTQSVYDHPEYLAQLAGVRAMPEDDLRRLVLADWLEERGDDTHARMIRFQCAPYPRHTQDCGGLDWSSRCEACHIDGQIATLLLAGADHRGGGLKARWEPLFSPHKGEVFASDPREGWQPERERHGRGCDVWATVKRGFVHTVRCRMADWAGTHCPRCNSRDRPPNPLPGCPDCDKGRTPGVGPRVMKAHPVERVVVTDREPTCDRMMEVWIWVAGSIPQPVLDLMPHKYARWVRSEGLYFDTTAAAKEALSEACVRWAESQHPLPGVP